MHEVGTVKNALTLCGRNVSQMTGPSASTMAHTLTEPMMSMISTVWQWQMG